MMNENTWQRILDGDEQTGGPARKLLGCQTTGQCFCTGRCKRTAEEQEAHERSQASTTLGRHTFEPKPGHGPTHAEGLQRLREMENAEFMKRNSPASENVHASLADIAGLPAASALDTQIGGDHYKTMGEFQPWSVLQAWLTPEEFRGYMKGTAIAYLARERQKGGDQDVSKATHTLQGLIEMLGAK